MLKKAAFPGTFDPFTNGHKDIVEKSLKIFDEVVIAIGINVLKKKMFPLDKRIEWIESVFRNTAAVTVKTYEGLTIDFCTQNDCKFIIRGLRTVADFE